MLVKTPRLLIVSQALDRTRRLAFELSELGFANVVTCASVEAALERTAIREPAVVIADVDLSPLDGFQLCRILKTPAYHHANHVPVILCSSSIRDGREAELAVDAGAFAFVETACGVERLVEHVDKALAAEARIVAGRKPLLPSFRALAIGIAEPATRDLLGEALREEGFRIDFGPHAAAALPPEEGGCDLVIVQAAPALESGANLLNRARRRFGDAPVIVLGNGSAPEDGSRELVAGAFDYIEGPATVAQMRSVCRRAMLWRDYRSNRARIASLEERLRAMDEGCRRRDAWSNRLMEGSDDGILVCDRDLHVAKLNPAACRILGTNDHDALGKSVEELLGEEPAAWIRNTIVGTRSPRTNTFEVARSIDVGRARTSVLSVTASLGDEGSDPEWLVVVNDVTEERQMRRRLEQAQKMDSLGALAGGIAHDFNNIVATILPHAEAIRHLCADDADVQGRAKVVENAARRGGELTERLLAFARPRAQKERLADPNASVDSTVAMLREILDRKIRVVSELMEQKVAVAIDPAQLDHALLNLAVNARDAMPEGGVLRFRTSLETMENGTSDGVRGPVVCVSVEDTGVGIEPADLEKIFEPFFTTKGDGKGTGLGLSTASGIIEAAGGRIEVDSRRGSGSCFRIYLPSEEGRRLTAPAEPSRPVPGRRERVLVVDDEETVLDLTAEMLGRLNYEVTPVATGREALDLVLREEVFDLVLLDMIMPDMDGRETYRRIRDSRPELAFLLTSGDPDNTRVTELTTEGVDILQKPFNLATLSCKVRSALAHGAAPDLAGRPS